MSDFRFLILCGTIWAAAAVARTSPIIANLTGIAFVVVALALHIIGWLP